MATIYLKHPVHGAKVATMEMEAEYDEKSGWVRYNPDTPLVTPEVAAPEETNTLRLKRAYNRKLVPAEGV